MIPSVVVEQVRRSILDYLKTTFGFADAEFERALFDFLEGERGLFRGPWLDVRLPFRTAAEADLETPPLDFMPPFRPYEHQIQAFEQLSTRDGRNPLHTLVTTGTGSGKTECFLYPVLDHCLRARRAGEEGVKAIILYPMNALATDQARRLARMLEDTEELKEAGVTAGLYIGGQGQHPRTTADALCDDRKILRDAPPDILLTNYRMLDFLLLRPEDAALWKNNGKKTLRYLVLDELHTYDGAQGSDVACLIRRLRARLGAGLEDICCVGTSATIGSESGRAGEELRRFAKEVFGPRFMKGSLVTEDRLSAEEALGHGLDRDLGVPFAATPEELDPTEAASPEVWFARQQALWLGEEGAELDEVALGERLSRHPFLRQVLAAIDGRPRALDEVITALGREDRGWRELDVARARMLVESFVALISRARIADPRPGDPGHRAPFLAVQVQLWVRELRALLRRVSREPGFCWEEDLGTEEAHHLPLAHCRECGADGFAALAKAAAEHELIGDRRVIGQAWLERSRHARFIVPGRESKGLFDARLDPDTLMLWGREEARDDALLPVEVEATLTGAEGRERFALRCPDCGSDDALRIAGARAPSLLSVAISEQFLSDYNEDQKLLAFTDSVQDAAHRAGFFGARTYRFNMRSAIQGLVEARADQSGEDLPLDGIGEVILDHWREHLSGGLEELVATLWPSDLRALEAYERFMNDPTAQKFNYLRARFLKRLQWEATLELGHAAIVGRSLENSGCATLRVDPERLSHAVKECVLILREEVAGGEGGFAPEMVRQFLQGLLLRLRQRGGVFDALLDTYVDQDGEAYFLSRRKNPLISPFGRRDRYPRFLSNRSRHKTFDRFRGKQDTWYRDWAMRSLQILDDQVLDQIYPMLLDQLARRGILKAVDSKKGGRVWGLAPAALLVTRDVARVRCEESGRSHLVAAADLADFAGAPSPRFRGQGRLRNAELGREGYYARIYRQGRMKRSFVGEHTGLLERERREALETRFKGGGRADDENILVCTPTLEMGIDIGDLSSVALCSVPPAPANYLQRVGRAGRSTGNALTLTLANRRPHDLYFMEDPEAMLAGAVDPPGCFLDAPEMLKRQAAAAAMDAWAREEASTAVQIPRKVELCLTKAGFADFPARFLDYERTHRLETAERFAEVFRADLEDESLDQIRAFIADGKIGELVTRAFNEVREEREELRLQKQRVTRRKKALLDGKAEPDPEKTLEDEIEELKHAENGLSRMQAQISSVYPLNVLTDRGVLPNYAFPEPGVVLKSVIRKREDDGGSDEGGEAQGRKYRYETVTYQRPASAALRELAPGNTFYAEGHQVRIRELDVGAHGKPPIDPWRFCPACHHAEVVDPTVDPVEACPRCEEPQWADAGQVRQLVRFTQSGSLSDTLESTTTDYDDDRARLSYEIQGLIDVDPKRHGRGGLVCESPLFGYELLHDLELFEINLGYRPLDASNSDLEIAGDERLGAGFVVCTDCGRVVDPEDQARRPAHAKVEHAPWCGARKGKAEKTERVYLYRQLKSEAIRVLLPTAGEDAQAIELNFRAALQLGFRRRFGGRPIHLAIRTMSEPYDQERGVRRRFLVIIDTVPGGTGYLTQLSAPEEFFDVLERARKALEDCRCGHEGRDGCYRCLFAYQEQIHLASLSRARGLELLEEILSARDALEPVKSLSSVRLATRLESELEHRFVKVLREYLDRTEDAAMRLDESAGEEVWEIEVGPRRWRMTLQKNLGAKDDVTTATRPDFLLECLDDPAVKKLAIYADGFEYHVCPKDPRGRVEDDVKKRQALIDSGNFLTWSLGWKDLDDFENAVAGIDHPLAETDLSNIQAVFAKFGVLRQPSELRAGPMAMLIQWLRRPDEDAWREEIEAAMTGFLGDRRRLVDDAEADRLEAALLEGPYPEIPVAPEARPEMKTTISAAAFHGRTAFLVRRARIAKAGAVPRIAMRLDDAWDERRSPGFEEDWRAFLRGFNLFQFLPHFEVTTTERLAAETSTTETVFADLGLADSVAAVAEGAADMASVEELTVLLSPALAALLRATMTAACGPPEIYFEIADARGDLLAQLDLAWPESRVGVMEEEAPRDRAALEDAGWRVFGAEASAADLIHAIRGGDGA
jgi:DEAD/DEAH box helicase domain-containing protein